MDKLFYIDGNWTEENVPIIGPNTHSIWMASAVFDGTRAFRRLAPDLDLHCQRLIDSARALDLKPPLTAQEVEDIVWEGIERFPEDAEIFIRPMFYAEDGFVLADPESVRFTLTLIEYPLPELTGFSACLSSYRRPAPDMAPTDAKAACLYPNVGRAIREANGKGFDTAVMLDIDRNVAEFATANLFFVKDGATHTPTANRTFLNGITRQRVITLLRDDGHEVVERAVPYQDVLDADEVFSTGNLNKVIPATRIDDRDIQPGPVMRRAHKLYFDYAEACGRR